MQINVVGAGLAGCEASLQLASYGIKVNLYEMKPFKFSPAHKMEGFAELVCSNSLGSLDTGTASGLLKEELKRLGSFLIQIAGKASVPAGNALAVDRNRFSKLVTDFIGNEKKITVINQEVTEIKSPVIIATGHLTSSSLHDEIARLLSEKYLYFYDAISPVIFTDSIDFSYLFRGSRYGKGGNDYLNIPLEKKEYEEFVNELVKGETVMLKEFEEPKYFERCMPVEVLAKRGINTLAYGPMKPVGFINPATGKMPYALVQLRQEDLYGKMYNMVGFQTKLTYTTQSKIFRMLAGLKNAEFARMGSVHRNTFLNAPKLITPFLNLKDDGNIWFAGQITGVEGYVESIASGLAAGINAAHILTGKKPVLFPESTVLGSLIKYITTAAEANFQPMNANFGLLPPLEIKKRSGKKERKKSYAERSLRDIENFCLLQKN